MVVEPVAALFGGGTSVSSLEMLDPLVCAGERGTHAAQYFDEGIDSDREQFIGPRLEYTLLSSEHPPRDWEDPAPLSLFLDKLKGDPRLALRLLGVVHYHADDPFLGPRDFSAMTLFAAGVRDLSGPSQVGMVLSDSRPLDSFTLRMAVSRDEFVRHMRQKVGSGQLDVTANLFDGMETLPPPVRVELTA